jgi:spore maturation protein CgeB
MNIAFFGSSLTSAYWNGAATYYRGLVRALHERGHRVTFFEPDAYDRQQHRDLPDPSWAEVVVYPPDEAAVHRALERARGADLVVKASGVGVFDELLEAAVLDLQRPETLVAFWDVDAPATLARMGGDAYDPFRSLVPRYDLVVTYGGGDPVVRAYRALGARACHPIYNGVDPTTHHPVPPDPAFDATLAFLGNRLPDRERRVETFFLEVASALPHETFLLGGSGWQDKARPANVRYLGHVYTRDHNAFNRTPRAVLNVSRDSMASTGFSPATRVFEAAAAEACLITDAWEGIDRFFEPDREILVAASGEEVVEHVRTLSTARARSIGERARRRALAEHTYASRAAELEAVLDAAVARRDRTATPLRGAAS